MSFYEEDMFKAVSSSVFFFKQKTAYEIHR